MATQKIRMATRETAGTSGRDLTTEPAPIDAGFTWLIVEKGVRVGPYEVVIKAREAVRVITKDIEAEINCKGITLKFKLLDTELIIDDRYNTALLRRRGELVAVSDRVKYYGVEMAAADFAMFVRRSVKELIEETLAKIGL